MTSTPPRPVPRLVAAATRDAEAMALAFAPALVRLEASPPSPLGRAVLLTLVAFVAALVIGSAVARLDIVAVAPGRLVPESFLKIVQPAEPGVVREILVKEGQAVAEGQVLMRMDAVLSEADGRTLEADQRRRAMTLRRIDAELGGREFQRVDGDPVALYAEHLAQYRANREAIESALAFERANRDRARQDLAAATQVRTKLAEILPHYRAQDAAFADLVRQGFAGTLMGSEKQRDRLEKEQELKTQEHVIESARAAVAQSERRLLQLGSDQRRQLHAERHEVEAQLERLAQDRAKQAHRRELLELRASQAGLVKDLATHTIGTVVQPGTVLLTVVPHGEALKAEVWVDNRDIGFVRPGQNVKVKLESFPFQQYGMADGIVEHVGVDALDGAPQGPAGATATGGNRGAAAAPSTFRALVALRSSAIEHDGHRLALGAGMLASAEILLGERTVLDYLTSPVRKAFHEAGRER